MTKEVDSLEFWRLRFVDEKEQDICENVLSKNLNTIRYYAKKMLDQNGWWLKEITNVWIVLDRVVVRKYWRNPHSTRRHRDCIRTFPLTGRQYTLDELCGLPPDWRQN